MMRFSGIDTSVGAAGRGTRPHDALLAEREDEQRVTGRYSDILLAADTISHRTGRDLPAETRFPQ